MSDKENPFPRDRDGVVFEDDLTDENEATPVQREKASHDLHPDPGVNSQEGDEFMKERKFPGGGA